MPFIHKSALINTVKFVEIQENGVRYTCTCLPGRSPGVPFSPSRRDGRKAEVTRVNSCAYDACGSYSYLYIEREKRKREYAYTHEALSSFQPESPCSFLAWAHLKRGPTLVATATSSHSAAAQSSPTEQGSFNFANTQLFNIVSR